ncbi:putative elongation factor [Gregarina niphandrodes]|uniref:Elongation factor n=1 Tax=Gregarina niphandrodes TaxID=110365 RepID=A0A023BAB3_GRENI|nr:putative elongation factor [Gregarina niphandrodes]EZG78203.1 putative elongation factor [Gregarina niphandrodes]|eukprot:XP_011129423.1 putative elongation factor [Gregarina niphandrodes]
MVISLEPTAAAVDDDLDLFGSDDDSAVDLKAQMAAKQKKAVPPPKKEKKPVIAKSSVTMEAMPYDAEKDISQMYETHIKKIEIDGLVWGPTGKVAAGPFGLTTLIFGCAIEDEKVQLEAIEEAVEVLGMTPEDAAKYCEMRRTGELEDYEEEWPGKLIGTVKVTSFNKI